MSKPARPRPSAPRAGARRPGKQILFALLAVVLGLALVEGLCSLSVGVVDLATQAKRPLAERQHTRYDAELGWVNVPSTRRADLYGPGRSLTINAQGFRGTRDTPTAPPPGKVRLVGSGDSFTLGFGVDDADTWCARLEAIEPRLETVNMGQGGYGIDQAYLWYERDGRRLQPRIHVFAFITSDFDRMRSDRFLGYGKPTLKLENGVPVADGVPVKRRSFLVPWWTQNAALLRRFGTVEVLTRLFGRSGDRNAAVLSGQETTELAYRAMLTMNRRDREQGCGFVAVWLPIRSDYDDRADDALRAQFLEALRTQGVFTVDLIAAMRRLPPEEVATLFLTSLPEEAVTGFVNARRHYSARGNAFVAAELLGHMRTMPGIAEWVGEGTGAAR